MPDQKERWKPALVGLKIPCKRKIGARPMTMVPEIVVAANIFVPNKVGMLPIIANKIIINFPSLKAFSSLMSLFKKCGTSTAKSFESAENEESSVDPAEVIITIDINKSMS